MTEYRSMDPVFLQAGVALAAIALIFGAFYLFFTGSSGGLGGQVREMLMPPLKAIRERSERSRSELADLSVLFGVVLAIAAAISQASIVGAIVAIVLFRSRPTITKATSEEQPLLAIAGQFSTDMIVGIYTPIIMAMALLGDVLMAACLASVIVALCWPPGGAGGARRRSGAWTPAWVNS